MMRPALGVAALAASVLLLSACTGDNDSSGTDNATTTTTSVSTGATSTASSPKPTQGSSAAAETNGAEPTSAAEVNEPAAESASGPTATCATDYTLYQPGTTFYSDGTSGYTAKCQAEMESLMAQSGQFPDYSYNNLPDPDYPDYIIGRTPDGAAIKAPDVQADANAGQQWWTDCMAVNDAATCRATDPWQQ